jgi:hypothetical protein
MQKVSCSAGGNGGRNALSSSANKDTRLNFRVSPHDRTAIIAKARRARVSVSDFCRKAALEKKVIYIEGLPALVYELNKIGTNMNQIAAAANQGRDISTTLPAIKARLSDTLSVIDRAIGGDGDSDCQAD